MENTPNEYTHENAHLLEPNRATIASFVGMARDIQHECGDRLLPIHYRENVQLMRIYDEPVAVDLWAQHIEETAPQAFRTSHILVSETGACLLYQHDFTAEPRDPEGFILPDTLLRMPKLSPGIINNNFGGILREELFEPISPDAFTQFYADIRWLRTQLHI